MYLLNLFFFVAFLFVCFPLAQTTPTDSNSSKNTDFLERPWVSLGVHLGVQFNSLQQRARLTDYSVDYRSHQQKRDDNRVAQHNANQKLSDTARTSQSKVLQPYQPVDIAIPIGLSLSIRTFSFLDLLFSTQSFWQEQVEIIEYRNISFTNVSGTTGGEIQNIPLKYGLQTHLGGIGARVHLPTHFISIRDSKPVIVQIQRLWHLWESKIYTSHGVLPAEFSIFRKRLDVFCGLPLEKIWSYTSYYILELLYPCLCLLKILVAVNSLCTRKDIPPVKFLGSKWSQPTISITVTP